MEIHKFPYNWKLAEANFTKDKGKVFLVCVWWRFNYGLQVGRV